MKFQQVILCTKKEDLEEKKIKENLYSKKLFIHKKIFRYAATINPKLWIVIKHIFPMAGPVEKANAPPVAANNVGKLTTALLNFLEEKRKKKEAWDAYLLN